MDKNTYKKPKTQTARRSVTPRKRLSESEGDNTCVVCAQVMVVHAVGHCNHYICFKCSTKIRLLCEESLCPVCRKDLPKVVFTKKKVSFEELNRLKLIKDKDYDVGIYFSDISIIKDYKHILEHKCPICKDRPPDRTFEQTKVHLRKEHTMFYCEICLEHNRTFTSECKIYSRKDLGAHKRVGDSDDRSHRGHPLCVYCDIRFLDDDKLFHHLRTTHFFCHLCDQGESNEFYGTYNDLREHFGGKHYLCEEGDCIDEEFTSVFATKIDFKAHCASVHKENRTKLQLKKDRQIDLGFQYSRRDQPALNNKGRGRGVDRPKNGRNRPHSSRAEYSNAFERESDLENQRLNVIQHSKNSDPTPSNDVSTKRNGENVKEKPKTLFYQTDFPDLSNVVLDVPIIESSGDQEVQSQSNSKENSKPLWSNDAAVVASQFDPEEDFPSLPTRKAPVSASTLWNSKIKTSKKKIGNQNSSNVKSFQTESTKVQSKKVTKQRFTQSLTNDEDFPGLPASKPSNKVTISATTHRNESSMSSTSKHSKTTKTFKKNLKNDDDFPKLSENSSTTPSANWLNGGREIGRTSSKLSNSSKPKSSNIVKTSTAPSNSKSTKANLGNNKKSQKATKKSVKKDEDFVNIPSSTEIIVGRGSSKHLEGFESFSAGTAPNISLITAKQKSSMDAISKSSTSKFTSDTNEFPSLSSLNPISAPPGFSGFAPVPFNLGDSLMPSAQKTTVKPPPGFENKHATNKVQSSSNADSLFTASNDFSSLPSTYLKGFSFDLTEKVEPSHETRKALDEQLEATHITKNHQRSKKKKQGFRSNDLDSDFPSLHVNEISSSALNNYEPVSKLPTHTPSTRQPSTGTSLNLANIFDF